MLLHKIKLAFWIHFSLVCVLSIGGFSSANDARSATVGYGGMVGSDHYLATEAGLSILKKGGNAADAALAVQWVLNVVRPFMTGIGGGCFIVYYDSKTKKVYNIDGREEAPNAYHSEIFCENDACFPQPTDQCDCYFSNQTISYPERAFGGLAVGVPGTVHAFYNLFKNFKSDKISWTETFSDAISIGREGFPMYEQFYEYVSHSEYVPNSYYTALRRFNASYNLYFNKTTDEPIAAVNETFYNPDLSNTFEILSKSAEDAIYEFYNGSIAQEIVNTVQKANNTVTNRWGLMTMDDISNYRSVFREPIVSTIENTNYVMYGMDMPSSGATTQYIMHLMNQVNNNNNEKLSNLSYYNISNHSIYSSEVIHGLISMFNIAFADRNYYMADSDFENVPVKGLLNNSYNRARAEKYFSNFKIDTPIDYGNVKYKSSNGNNINLKNESEFTGAEHGTSHFFVIDKDNNIACITTTIEYIFGSSVTVPNRGFTLNNELTDFDVLGFDYINNRTVANGPEGGKRQRKTALNLFDLKNDNNTFGGKRPRSSMSPMIIFEKQNTTKKDKKEEKDDKDETEELKPYLVVGSPGGSTIIESVFQVLSKVLVWDIDVQLSIDAPRIWSFNTDSVTFEPAMWQANSNLYNELTHLGYNITKNFQNSTHGSVAAVKFDLSSGGNEWLEKNNYYVLYGGVDDQRVLEASVQAVCQGDGKTGSDRASDESSVICAELSTSITSLTTEQRVGLIIVWVVVLIIAALLVRFRQRVKMYICCKKDSDNNNDSSNGNDNGNEFYQNTGNGMNRHRNNSTNDNIERHQKQMSKKKKEYEQLDDNENDNEIGVHVTENQFVGESRKAQLSADIGSKESLDRIRVKAQQNVEQNYS